MWRGVRVYPLRPFPCGESHSTVDPALAEKVWRAIEEVGYLPNTQRGRWSQGAAICWA